jgi:hypothetical protein
MYHASTSRERAAIGALLCATLSQRVDTRALAAAWNLDDPALALLEDAGREQLSRVYTAVVNLSAAIGAVSPVTLRRLMPTFAKKRIDVAMAILASPRPSP